MHEMVKDEIWKKHLFFWNVTLIGLEEAYLLGLSKFFDRPSELDQTISIYYFIDSGKKELVSKLKKTRNKMLVHDDKKTTLNKGTFLQELGLNKSDIISLFELAIELIDEIKGKFGIVTNIKQYFEHEKEKARKDFETWFEVFKKGFQS